MPATTFKKKVLLALSGGVDSSLCAHLLMEEGYQVEALCLKMSCHHENTVKDAQAVAAALGIPFHSLDVSKEFESIVVADFIENYENGRTPNPCTLCNKTVKFRFLLEFAEKNGFDYIATGHYARVCEYEGRHYVFESSNIKKDQSYMLYRLSGETLERLILPLGEFSKEEVRLEANKRGLISANKPDSQEICFIPDNDYGKFLIEAGAKNTIGDFIGPENEFLGKNKGIIHYTIGQRKGLGIAYKEPLYVTKIDSESGNVYLGVSGEEFFSGAFAENIFLNHIFAPQKINCLVKIRSAAKKATAAVEFSENGRAKIIFEEKQRAVCPGQSIVFYDESRVLGGGTISEGF